MKARLMQLTNSRVVAANGERDTGPKRPTLKRRTESGDQTQPGQPGDDSGKDRPTLKRRDADGSPDSAKPADPVKPADPNKPADPSKP